MERPALADEPGPARSTIRREPTGLSPVLQRTHPDAGVATAAGRAGGECGGAGRGGDHPLHRQHALRLPAPRLVRFWIVANSGWLPGVPAWDPSFVVLAMVASVEAIFLSTFVLISQNRMAAAADKRADLDLQVSLLAEHEVTKLTTLVSGIADRLGVKSVVDDELDEITRDVAPEAVLDEIETMEPASRPR